MAALPTKPAEAKTSRSNACGSPLAEATRVPTRTEAVPIEHSEDSTLPTLPRSVSST